VVLARTIALVEFLRKIIRQYLYILMRYIVITVKIITFVD